MKNLVSSTPDMGHYIYILADTQDMIPLGGNSYYYPPLNTDFEMRSILIGLLVIKISQGYLMAVFK